MASVPSGIHFMPNDIEILSYYLTKITKEEPLETRAVVKKNIYDDQYLPWEIFTENEPWFPDGSEYSKKHLLYVYTKLSYVGKVKTDGGGGGGGRKNVKRRSGRGSWSGQRGDDVFNENQEVIGYLRKFSYEPDKNWLDVDTMRKEYGSWSMHEYSLKGITGSSDYVLCKIMVNLNSKEHAVAPTGFLNFEALTVIEQEDLGLVPRLLSADLSNQGLIVAVDSHIPVSPSRTTTTMIIQQREQEEEGIIPVIPETNTTVSNNSRWIPPESTYATNAVSFDFSDEEGIILVNPKTNTAVSNNSRWILPESTYATNDVSFDFSDEEGIIPVNPEMNTAVSNNSRWILSESTYSTNDVSFDFSDEEGIIPINPEMNTAVSHNNVSCNYNEHQDDHNKTTTTTITTTTPRHIYEGITSDGHSSAQENHYFNDIFIGLDETGFYWT